MNPTANMTVAVPKILASAPDCGDLWSGATPPVQSGAKAILKSSDSHPNTQCTATLVKKITIPCNKRFLSAVIFQSQRNVNAE